MPRWTGQPLAYPTVQKTGAAAAHECKDVDLAVWVSRLDELDELRRAREQHGTVTSCPKCGKQGDIDALFGWRRMKPGRDQIHPQSWCLECRQTSWRKAPQR